MTAQATSVSTLSIRLFGPIQVLVGGCVLPPLRSRKALWLLALLVLRHGRPVDRDWLAGSLWPDTDQAQALASLRTVLSELRKALGSEGSRLHSPDRHTLSIDLEDADVDLVSFENALASARTLDLEQAVAFYSGPFLEGCNEEWVHQERAARELDCLKAFQTLADAALSSGDFESAAAKYRQAIAIDPWWDAARRGLMEALAKGGDTNEALQVYRSFEELLRGESRAVPDEKTTSLYLKLRKEARERSMATHATTVVEVVPNVVSGRVPSPLTDLIGREDECRDVCGLLRRSRLVTLTGLGGIGKTRLAIAIAAEVGREFQDGVWFVPLESISQPSMVPQQIASLFDLKPSPGQSWIASVTDHLRSKRLVLILDNCEHLLDACAQNAAHLLQECAGVRILTTSREALGITGETAWNVPSLAVPDPEHLPNGAATLRRVLVAYEGVQLFIERAKASHKDFSLTDSNSLTLAKVCSRLEGIPLAIELAAARVKAMTLEQIAEHLHDHLGFLSKSSRTGQPRQQALRSTLDWSYRLLSDAEQHLLRRLSVFVGGWTLEAAEKVCSDEELQIAEMLTSLVDKSLVIFEDSGSDLGERFRLLEVVRQYSAEKLEGSGEKAPLLAKYRAWYLEMAEEADLNGPSQQKWLHWLDSDVGNLRSALDGFAEDEQGADHGMRLAGVLGRYWYMRGDFSEGRKFLERALERDESKAPTRDRAKALHGIGVLCYRQGDHSLAKSYHEASLAIRRELQDPASISDSLLNLGNISLSRGEYEDALSLYLETLTIAQELGDKHRMSVALSNLGNLRLSQGENPAAREWFEVGLEVARELNDNFKIAWALNMLGILAEERGDYVASMSYFDECHPLFEELGERRGIAWTLNKMACVAHDVNDYEMALRRFEECLEIFRAMGDRHGEACTLHELALVDLDLGEMQLGRSRLQAAMDIFHAIEEKHGVGYSWYALGALAYTEGDLDGAEEAIGKSVRLFRELREVRGIAANLEEYGKVLLARSEVERAVTFWGASSKLREGKEYVLSPNLRAKLDPQIEKARLELGDNAFEQAWEKGRSRSEEQAVAQVLANA